MNTGNIKRYAPKARTAFIAAMTKRAALFGIRESSIPSMGIELLEQKGDLALIGDRPFPASIIRPRVALVKKVEQIGFALAMEQAAYSWFNRLCAIRYMELKGYLEHGRRVLSHPDQLGSIQILDDCLDIELEGLDHQRIAELKLDGTRDEELYRELLLAQCHALHKAMPFLFEAVDDATELLLPDNLIKTDSLIRELVSAIPEEDWQDVEIIGWLYQFYVLEEKERIDKKLKTGKPVESEEIPAKTQLFTPNWIVKYLVQNSVGRQWLQTYQYSPIKAKMPYYIESADQLPDVQAQLAAITPDSIDPLTIKVLDPACGSGHILVEAYKVLKEIYTERGFRSRDIPCLILEHNLFGLDIDDRAGQLAGFALMMLAREDDRRIFNRLAGNGFKLNVLSLQESSHLDFEKQWKALNLTSDWQRGQSHSLFDNEQTDLGAAQADSRYKLLKSILVHFTQAKTFGSLIDVPAEDAEPLCELLEQLRQLAKDGDVMQKPAAQKLIPYVQQAWVLAQRYDAVVANPPYMGSGGMNSILKDFAKQRYPNSKSDLFAIFMEHTFNLLKPEGYNAQVNMQSWMFLSSYEKMRERILDEKTIITLMQIGYNSFPELNSKIVQCCASIIKNIKLNQHCGTYIDLNSAPQSADKNVVFTSRGNSNIYFVSQNKLNNIPGSPIAYWLSESAFSAFSAPKLYDIGITRRGLQTGSKDRYIRLWHECSLGAIEIDRLTKKQVTESKKKWFLFNNGGDFRKWYGNLNLIVEWEKDGLALKSFEGAIIPSESLYFEEGICWPRLGSGLAGFRLHPKGFIPGDLSPCFYSEQNNIAVMAYLNSKVSHYFLNAINPTLTMPVGDMAKIPFMEVFGIDSAEENARKLLDIHKSDWNDLEVSFDFKKPPIQTIDHAGSTLKATYRNLRNHQCKIIIETQQLEENNNKIFINSYSLQNELTPDVSFSEISLACNPSHRYGGVSTDEGLEARLQADTLAELISYAIGCIMGRYSLDRDGLVYAHAGNLGFAELVIEGAYKTFPADNDGILPLTDQEWFADDATNRFREFVRSVWGDQHLQENLDFVAESLCLYAIKPKRGESALDTIRRYLCTQFFKDHLRTYNKRPIYWLFSSGKHKAFECLIYLHRYNEGTLARMRTEYVGKLIPKLSKYAETLQKEIDASTSTAEKKNLEKKLATLHSQQAELATFDEKLRHYADQRISLDLDQGVKVNYGKFGELLAEVKAITGGATE
jgi:type II restriction/modification system DNA methylase subunit YeeA